MRTPGELACSQPLTLSFLVLFPEPAVEEERYLREAHSSADIDL